nr:hypothetical protein [Streptomyces sp. 846.5]
MNRRDLQAQLDAEEVRPDAYSLDGGLPDEALCLGREGAKWVTYYSERGLRSGLRRFPDEASACADLLAQLQGDRARPPRPQS